MTEKTTMTFCSFIPASARQLVLVFLFALAAKAAEWAPDPRLSIDWSRAGVPGGIQQYIAARTNLIDVTAAPYFADNTGVTNAQVLVQAAVNAAVSNDVIYLPEGTYRFDLGVGIGDKSGITIRGDGPEKTRILFYPSWGSAFYIGGEWDWKWNEPGLVIINNPSKGDTVLAMASTSVLDARPNGGVGMLCELQLDDSTNLALDAEFPVVVSSWSFRRSRKSMHRIVAKTATTVTIDPPLVHGLPSSMNPTMDVSTRVVELSGVEDLKIDAINSTSSHGTLQMNQSWACWFSHVETRNPANRSVWIERSVQCEIRKCRVEGTQGAGSNQAGVLVPTSGFCLFVDNTILGQEQGMEINGGSGGNVIAYNLVGQNVQRGINGNHNPHNSFNLYEGNVCQSWQSDGYHGSGSQDTLFRNWIHGDKDIFDGTWSGGWTIALNRYCRQFSIVGNVLEGIISYSFGNPNMGNPFFEGTATPSAGDVWADWANYPGTVGVYIGDGFQELDLDVGLSTTLVHNWLAVSNGVPTVEELPPGDTLPDSLYLTGKPTFFGNLQWPPVDPNHPTTNDITIIPAGYRYINGNDPPAGETDTVAPAAPGSVAVKSANEGSGIHAEVNREP